MKRLLHWGMILLVIVLTLSACVVSQAAPEPPAPSPANREVILGTTTSTQDSGLLDVLLPLFTQKTGYQVKAIAVGSGQAMTLGERGEADVLLVHAPESEERFMAAGHGIDRRLVMHNDFILVGPASDPAGVKGSPTATAALQRLALGRSLFISRADNSGTDQLEKQLWRKTSIDPRGQTWYQETGQGMGATLQITANKGGYTLTDRATYLANKRLLDLTILLSGDPALFNVYHVILVNPRKSNRINVEGARAFADFVVNAPTQQTIGNFGKEKYGEALFVADAGKSDTAAK